MNDEEMEEMDNLTKQAIKQQKQREA